MTVRHMKIFIQVYKIQNVTKAAEKLNMTQPAVTRAIQEIENYYGVCLFERINKRIYRTEISRQLYSQAIHIVEIFDTMEKTLRNWDTFGFIRVGATVTLGNFLLPNLVMYFQKKYPDIKIQVTISNSDNIKKGLINNQLDIALVENNINEAELYTEPIDKDCILLIVPPNHELLSYKIIELEEVIKYPILLREKGSTTRDFVDNYFAVYGISIRPVWVTKLL